MMVSANEGIASLEVAGGSACSVRAALLKSFISFAHLSYLLIFRFAFLVP